LGVMLARQFDESEARANGLHQLMGTRISGVEPNSPAEQAGLRVDDVIVLYDGQRVERDKHLITRVKLTPVGRSVELIVMRDGQPIRKSVTIGDLRETMPSDGR
jgi:serine protease Do